MKWFLLIFILTVHLLIAQNYSHVTELRGFEDEFGKTHLFYRAGNDYNSFNPVYHFNIDSNKIELFIDAFYWGFIYYEVRDFEFWRNNPDYYIYCGTMLYPDNHVYISRFDNAFISGPFGYDNLEISSQNDSIVYSGKPLYKSTTGGRLWEFVSNLNLISLSKFNGQILFLSDNNNRLRKSTDGGVTSFYSEITSKWDYSNFKSRLYFDADSVHIYGVTDKKIFISSDGGEIWNLIFVSQKDITFSYDPLVSGRFCFAEGKNIYISNNYGQTISLYKRLNRDVIGVHLKSNSNKIYAATQFQILEITPDTVKSLKDFSLPDNVINYYPLKVGNKWYFNTVDIDQSVHPPIYTYGFLTREVIKDSLADNGKRYYVIEQIPKPTGAIEYFLERIDSATGLIYRYEKTISPTKEYVIDDLLANVSDTLSINRFFPPGNPYAMTIFIRIDTVQFANKDYVCKHFYSPGLISFYYMLMDSIGLAYISRGYDFGSEYTTLKGCRINGKIYGDTLLVKVEEDYETSPNNFILYQNYPNPFGEATHSGNSSTTIKFHIPHTSTGSVRCSAFITLKVYDVLGREVATLVNEEKAPGKYISEFRIQHSALPSGVYFYQLHAGGYVETKKMILMK